jgi:hypothetical protein
MFSTRPYGEVERIKVCWWNLGSIIHIIIFPSLTNININLKIGPGEEAAPLLDSKSPDFLISEVRHFSFTSIIPVTVIFPHIVILMILWAHVLPSVHTLIPIVHALNVE